MRCLHQTAAGFWGIPTFGASPILLQPDTTMGSKRLPFPRAVFSLCPSKAWPSRTSSHQPGSAGTSSSYALAQGWLYT